MNNAIIHLSQPGNEPIYNYKPGTKEYKALMDELERQSGELIEIPIIIDGKEIKTGNTGYVTMPHNHQHKLAIYHKAGENEVKMAIDASLRARESWMNMSWIERASIFKKVAELISQKYRYLINASTMLGQGKNAFQSEIDSVCEVVDYLRFNAFFASQIYNQQPISANDAFNRVEYRPLEGFVLAISPFNFTAIGLNLVLSPAIMGNTVVWKPATTSLLSNYYLMKIYKEAGMPDGVINFVPGSGAMIGDITINHPMLAGVHFTGGTNTFKSIWKKINNNLDIYRSYPKIVGETGGKGFVFVHKSSDPRQVAIALIKGSFEYQGQKCSAASRSYIPASLWPAVKQILQTEISTLRMGDVKDVNNFINAVIDEASFENIMNYINFAKESPEAEIITGGKGDKSVGYFVEPTIVKTTNPHFKLLEEEIFGPVMTIFVYEDEKFEETLKICDETSPYALTGSIFAEKREDLLHMCRVLRYAAGNFYYNDKPSGAVVGLQPFGGARMSGTNDKAGGYLNLIRWVSPRTIKETFNPGDDYRYEYMK